jgi:HlyD family secretion protein
MKKRTFFISGAILIVLIAIIFIYVNSGEKSDVVKTTGIIEGTEVNLSPQVSGILSFLCCNEGDSIKQGDIAFRIESSDVSALVEQAKAGVKKSKAEIMVSESALASAGANIRSAEADIKNAEAGTQKAQVQMELAKKEMDRADELYKKEFVAKDSVDVAATQYHVSSSDYTASQSGLASAYSRRDAAQAQLRTAESQIQAARAGLKQSEATLNYNLARLAYTTVSSPVSGVVVLKALEKGEIVSPGMTVLTIVDMNDLYVRADIEETLIDGIALGSEAIIRAGGSSGKVFKGKVAEVGRYAGFATQTDVTRGRQDIKTFRVKIRFGDTGGALKPGMTVEVEIPKKK